MQRDVAEAPCVSVGGQCIQQWQCRESGVLQGELAARLRGARVVAKHEVRARIASDSFGPIRIQDFLEWDFRGLALQGEPLISEIPLATALDAALTPRG